MRRCSLTSGTCTTKNVGKQQPKEHSPTELVLPLDPSAKHTLYSINATLACPRSATGHLVRLRIQEPKQSGQSHVEILGSKLPQIFKQTQNQHHVSKDRCPKNFRLNEGELLLSCAKFGLIKSLMLLPAYSSLQPRLTRPVPMDGSFRLLFVQTTKNPSHHQYCLLRPVLKTKLNPRGGLRGSKKLAHSRGRQLIQPHHW